MKEIQFNLNVDKQIEKKWNLIRMLITTIEKHEIELFVL